MEEIIKDFRKGESGYSYPEIIKNNSNAQAFYGVAEEVISGNNETLIREDELGELALKIDKIIRENSKVDWYDNVEVHNRIAQEIDDLLFDFSKEKGLYLSFDKIDEMIEKVKNVAVRRY